MRETGELTKIQHLRDGRYIRVYRMAKSIIDSPWEGDPFHQRDCVHFNGRMVRLHMRTSDNSQRAGECYDVDDKVNNN